MNLKPDQPLVAVIVMCSTVTLTNDTLMISAAFGVGMVIVPPYAPPVRSPEIVGLVSEVYQGLKISTRTSLIV